MPAAMDMRNISRFTYATTSFQGWRLSLRRCGYQFTAYFPDHAHGGEQQALQAALDARAEIFAALAANPQDPKAVLKEFRTRYTTDKG